MTNGSPEQPLIVPAGTRWPSAQLSARQLAPWEAKEILYLIKR
jgi:hypothetical protein